MSNNSQLPLKNLIKTRETWFESGKALRYLEFYFRAGKKEIRIASGFFSLKGWGFVRNYTKNKKVYLLVGLEKPGEDRARKALISEIMRDLRTGLYKERRQAVQDLVGRMESEQFEIVDARALNHHAKLYLVDETVAIIASSNLTGRGLIEQIEVGSIVTKQYEVLSLIEEFDNYFKIAKDLTQELLEALKQWLKFVRPWDIYLKTMLALENLPPLKSNYKKQPVNYQVDMIAQTLRQILEYNGSMLVASTGLGKTVVAVHVALHLKEQGEIDNVMVIGPKPVQKSWRHEMRKASLPCDYFNYQMLDQPTSDRDSNLEIFEAIAETFHEQRWLLIIDESHIFRNRHHKALFNLTDNPEERLAFNRLRGLFNPEQNNPKVLLLTGSPYAKDIDNINHQLYLLPHTGESRVLFPEFIEDAYAWHIPNTEEFIKLPVASQLTTPHVVRYYGQRTETGNYYIEFEKERRYIPEIILHNIDFTLPLEPEMSQVITENYFVLTKAPAMFKRNIERLVRVAWTSSPLALREMLERIIDTPGGTKGYKFKTARFSKSRLERQTALTPIIKQLRKYPESKDIKLMKLLKIINTSFENQEKVIIFCERHPTVSYLQRCLSKLVPSLRIAHTLDITEDGSYKMAPSKKVEKHIEQFAPFANNAEGKYQETYDVFITTDAYGVGVNMQDASVVVNYDIDWTPIGPIQRAGRVLRFWHSPRTIQVYTFLPTLTNQNPFQSELMSIERRWEKLMERHDESKKIIDLPVLTEEQRQEIDLFEVAPEIGVKSGKLNLESLADVAISPYFEHTRKLQDNRDYAEHLPSDIISAKIYQKDRSSIYVLLKHSQKYHGLIYTPDTQKLEEPTAVKLLNIIQCYEETEVALVDFNLVEELADRCIQAWCQQENIDPEEVTRECTLYLKSIRDEDTVEEFLND